MSPTPAKKSVLIVEDERPLAHALELKLQHEGLDTTVASDGQSALDLLAKQSFDIMLLDIMLPVMDGFQVLEALKAQPQKPVIFALSSLRQHEDEKRALALGARKYFPKTEVELETIVDEVKNA